MTVAGGGTTPPARRPRGRVLALGGSLAEKGQTAEQKAGVSTDGRPDPQAAASARMTVVESRRRRDPMFIGPHEAELLTGGESVPFEENPELKQGSLVTNERHAKEDNHGQTG